MNKSCERWLAIKMAKAKNILRIALVRSPVGRLPRHRSTIKALGLHKINQVVTHEDTPQIRGMINQVSYLLKVEEA